MFIDGIECFVLSLSFFLARLLLCVLSNIGICFLSCVRLQLYIKSIHQGLVIPRAYLHTRMYSMHYSFPYRYCYSYCYSYSHPLLSYPPNTYTAANANANANTNVTATAITLYNSATQSPSPSKIIPTLGADTNVNVNVNVNDCLIARVPLCSLDSG